MTAKITTLFSCPKCNSDMSSADRPKKCPKCGLIFTPVHEGLVKEFAWGKAPYRQLYELVQQDMEKFKDQPIGELLPEMPEEMKNEVRVSNQNRMDIIQSKRKKEMNKFFLNSSPLEIKEWLESVMHMFQIMHYTENKEVLALCGFWAKRYGEYYEDVMKGMLTRGTIFEKI